MSDFGMCIHGYGTRLEAIWPYVDTDKLRNIIWETYGCTVDTAQGEHERDNDRINQIDMYLAEHTTAYSLSEVFDRLDASQLIECVADNRAEWFFYLPSCMPWEYGDGMPRTAEAADTLLLRAIHPLLKDMALDDEVAAHFGDLRSIS